MAQAVELALPWPEALYLDRCRKIPAGIEEGIKSNPRFPGSVIPDWLVHPVPAGSAPYAVMTVHLPMFGITLGATFPSEPSSRCPIPVRSLAYRAGRSSAPQDQCLRLEHHEPVCSGPVRTSSRSQTRSAFS